VELTAANEIRFKTDPNWFEYLDNTREMAGGVPFILRFGPDSSGIVYTKNLTPDMETGLGTWTEADIVKVLRTGQRKDGTSLFLFPPHSYYSNLSERDAQDIAKYLASLAPVRHEILPRSVPFEPTPVTPVQLVDAPSGRTTERATYLMRALVGCKECHSHHRQDGSLAEFHGGSKGDPFLGSFRLGPDLPLRQQEKGFAVFPYPGYAVLYSQNLTRFGLGGDLSHVSSVDIVAAIRDGVRTSEDRYGRQTPLNQIMMWPFYASMSDDDAYSIAEYLKTLRYEANPDAATMDYYGTDWARAFEAVFGEPPSQNDRVIFGK
jgi:cytochrome c553